MAINEHFPMSCATVGEFNQALAYWLVHSDPRSTLGSSHSTVLTRLMIGNELCELRGGSSREGVHTYLGRALEGRSDFAVVASTSGVVHRVSLGENLERIRGLYLYTSTVHSDPRVIASADGSAFGTISLHLKLHHAVAQLHASGHQRLRVIPGVADMGYRLFIFLADHLIAEADDRPWWMMEPVWAWDGTDQVGPVTVRPSTRIEDIARAMISIVDDPGVGIDWAYAGWYAELVSTAQALGELPVGFSPSGHDYALSWTIGKDVAFPPPPPVPRRRIGFDDVFPSAANATPIPASASVPVKGRDVTTNDDFWRLSAAFDESGAFIGLFAAVANGLYSRSEGSWHAAGVDFHELDERQTVEVSYRFIKTVDLLQTVGALPTLEQAAQMRLARSEPDAAF